MMYTMIDFYRGRIKLLLRGRSGGICHRSRRSVGPTGNRTRNEWMILVDECFKCGRMKPIHPDRLNYWQRRWVERWNANNSCALRGRG